MKIKICGITNFNDALDAIEAGCDALGFVFYKNSPRYINPQNAKLIIEKLPPFVKFVGLFVNENEEFINNIANISKIDLAQVIDDDKIIDYNKLNIAHIKVVRVKSEIDLQKINDDEYYLVDAFVENFGGSGTRINLDFFKNIDCSKIILAGGLNSNNLKELNGFNFYGVDVSSFVEISKGKKDKEKMIDFIKKANEII